MRSVRCLTTMALLCVLAVTQQVRGQATRRPAKPVSKRWALLIGVEDYIRLEKLHYCGADMRALRERLTWCGFPQRQITLLEDKAAEKKFMPFKSSIEDQFDQTLKMVEREDLLLVAFSGHGVSIKGKSYLCPVDAKLTDADSMICVETLYERLSKCPAALKVVLVDACRDDPRLGGDKSAASAPDQRELAVTLERPPEGIYCLTSCSPGERSKEDPKLGHGVFMHFVLDGLRGKADVRNRGKVSLEDLCRYARDETKFYVREKFNDVQRPYFRIESSDDFDIALKGEVTNSIGMKLALIPAGEFLMGGSVPPKALAAFVNDHYLDDWGARSLENQRFQHRVRIAKPLYMGTCPVTRGEFRKFVEEEEYRTDAEKQKDGGQGYDGKKFEYKSEYNWRNAGFEQTDSHPVVNVSWNDAAAYCDWLSKKEGRKYRLPTEAEWEYACRAGTTTLWWSGDDVETLAEVANVADATAKTKFPDWKRTLKASDGYTFTAPVGSFRPNAFGLYDMHGNVWQFCSPSRHAEFDQLWSDAPNDDVKLSLALAYDVSEADWKYFGLDLSDLTLVDAKGKAVDWAKSPDAVKVLFIEFPHTCTTCAKTLPPIYKDLLSRYAGRNVRFDLVNPFPDQETSRFAAELLKLFAPLTDVNSFFKKRLEADAFPIVIVVGRDSRIVLIRRSTGGLKSSTDTVVSALLRGRRFPSPKEASMAARRYLESECIWTDPQDDSSAADGSIRGGDWHSGPLDCRSGCSDSVLGGPVGWKSHSGCNIGFRVVRAAE